METMVDLSKKIECCAALAILGKGIQYQSASFQISTVILNTRPDSI